jgi:hypothetical protein
MKVLLLAVAFPLCLLAQTSMTVGQLRSFLESSVELKQPDRKVAEYLKRVRLTERLSDWDVIKIAASGVGPRTLEALNELKEASKSLPAAKAESAVAIPTPRPMPDPPASQQKQVIEEARQYALGYSKRLPDFICLQVTRRYADPSGLEAFSLLDTFAARLSFFEQKEDYKLVSVNGAYADVSMDRLGGATSSGEFGSMLRELFDPATAADFRWERWAKLRGRIAHVYRYRVLAARSKWRISWQRQLEIVPGYHGLVYIDREIPMILRITLEADEIPPSFPIQQAGTVLDYDFTDISGNEFLLPLRAEMRMREGRMLVRNHVEFRNYRKFGAEAVITFDVPEPLSEEKTAEGPPDKK